MKKAALVCVAALSLALAACGQGVIDLDNAVANNGVTDLTAGNYYTGPYGLQVLELSPAPTGSALVSLLSGINGLTGLQAYNAMLADGFTAVTGGEFDNQTMNEGTIALGQQTFVNLPVGNIVLGLVAWNTRTTFAALPATAHVGALAFPQTVVNVYVETSPLDLHAGWNSVGEDLVMVPIPEPGALALAGLGLAALLIFRRRK